MERRVHQRRVHGRQPPLHLGGYIMAKWSLLASLVSIALVPGCALRSQSSGELGTSDQLLVADNQESNDTDDDLESGVDEPLSGAESAEASPAAPKDASEHMARVKSNPGRFFQPAGCITTSVVGNVATHVFNNCTGPKGLRTFNGTVVSTWTIADGKLTVSHQSQDFQINGATISGSRIVTYVRKGAVVDITRDGNWSGTTASGKAISHVASSTAVYDPAKQCLVVNGHAQSSIGKRDLSRTAKDVTVCGLRRRNCPSSGEVVLTREARSVKISFLGGQNAEASFPNGTTVDFKMACVAN
jgi:hypothetical protein